MLNNGSSIDNTSVIYRDSRTHTDWHHLCIPLAGFQGCDIYIMFGTFDWSGKSLDSSSTMDESATLAIDDISVTESPCTRKYITNYFLLGKMSIAFK